MVYEAHVSTQRSWHHTKTPLSPVWVQTAWAYYHVRHTGQNGMPLAK